jgi:hypothetical protein
LLALAWVRLAGALFGDHVALAVGALALLGLGLGGVAAHAFDRLGSERELGARLALWACAVSASSVVALLAFVREPLAITNAKSLLGLAPLLALATLPFVFTGAALATAFRDAKARLGGLCAAMWIGAALGAAGAMATALLGPPQTALVVAFIAALAAAVFGWGSQMQAGEVEIVVTLLLAPMVLLLSNAMAPWLKLPSPVAAPQADLQAWTGSGRVTADRAMAGKARVRTDGGSVTWLVDAKSIPPREPGDLAYGLDEGEGPVLILAPGGGRDVRAALDAKQTDLHVVEPSRYIVEELVRGRYGAFTGGLYDKSEVHVTIANPRSYVASSSASYRAIIAARRDDTDAALSGEAVLRPSELFTVEGIADLLAHLAPEGTLALSAPDRERERLLALAIGALRARGAADPLQHVFGVSLSPTTSLIVTAAPLPAPTVQKLRTLARRSRLMEVLAPDAPAPALSRAASALTPPTDDRPFFVADPARLRPIEVLKTRAAWAKHQGLWALVALVALGLVAAMGTLALAHAGAGRAGPGRRRGLTFFAALGAASALGAVALFGRLASFAGGPGDARAALLVVGLTGAALGSLTTARIELARAAASARWRAAALAVLFAALAVALDPALGHLRGQGLSARIAVAHALAAMLGALVGGLGSLGVRLVASDAPSLAPACAGAWGAWTLVAVAAGMWLALASGGAVVLLLGGWVWLLAAGSTPRPGDVLEQGR